MERIFWHFCNWQTIVNFLCSRARIKGDTICALSVYLMRTNILLIMCTSMKSLVQASLYILVNLFSCPPPFRRKAEGHSFRHSVLPSFRPSVFPSFRPPNIVGTLCAQLLLQFYADSFETLQMFLSWSEDMHVVWILS